MFHTHDYWYFERLDGGGVRITQREPGHPFGKGPILTEHVLTAEAWASVVAHVSAAGETEGTFHGALRRQLP
jgi:hypothetical protein